MAIMETEPVEAGYFDVREGYPMAPLSLEEAKHMLGIEVPADEEAAAPEQALTSPDAWRDFLSGREVLEVGDIVITSPESLFAMQALLRELHILNTEEFSETDILRGASSTLGNLTVKDIFAAGNKAITDYIGGISHEIAAKKRETSVPVKISDKPISPAPDADVDTATWQDYGNCLGVDADLFFPERGASTKEAKEVCRGCEVKDECLEYALNNGEKFGIWGGMSERERRRIRRQRYLARRAGNVAIAD